MNFKQLDKYILGGLADGFVFWFFFLFGLVSFFVVAEASDFGLWWKQSAGRGESLIWPGNTNFVSLNSWW